MPINTEQISAERDLLQELVADYTAGKQQSLMQMKRGQLTKEMFLAEHGAHVKNF